jgi:hypothetical protein
MYWLNKRETLIKQIGYSQVSYKIYRKKYLPVGKTSQILPLSELFVFTITPRPLNWPLDTKWIGRA